MGFGVFGDPKPRQRYQTGSSNQANIYPLLDTSWAGHWLCLTFGNQSKYLNSFNNVQHTSFEAFQTPFKTKNSAQLLTFIIIK